MKILRLRFKNLNSLVGEWSIDFTAPGYLTNGIFAISGPTGSGKSTILDAICLALYGATPRLGKITKTANEIMSRHTGECFAEVVFHANDKGYICHWSQQRSRKKANANLQEPRHEIAEADGGRILAEKLTEVKEVVEEKTGMDFNRFTQSMLLAQGGFAVFLKATPDQRAPILEQITGTDIYSDISKQVFERQKTEKESLDSLKNESKGVLLLSEEETSSLEKELLESQNKTLLLRGKKTKLMESIQWLNTIHSLITDLDGIASEEQKLSEASSAFEPEKEVLQKGIRAATLEGEFMVLTNLRYLQQEDIKQLDFLAGKLPESEMNLQSSREKAGLAEESLRSFTAEKESESEFLKIARAKDKSIELRTADFKKVQTQLKESEKNLSAEIIKKQDLENSLQKLSVELAGIDVFLQKNGADAFLITELAGIKEKIKGLKEERIKAVQTGARSKETEQQIIAQSKKVAEMEAKLKELQEKKSAIADNQSRLRNTSDRMLDGRTKSDIHAEIGSLVMELSKFKKIEDFETERKQLADNVPCPLCGSLLHPWAEGNIPRKSGTEQKFHELTSMTREIEKLEKEIDDQNKKEKEVSEELVNAEIHVSRESKNLELLKQQLTTHRNQEKEYSESVNRKSEELLEILAPLDIYEIPCHNLLLDQLFTGLELRKKNLEVNKDRKISVDKEISDVKGFIATSETKMEGIRKAISDKTKEKEEIAGEVAELVKSRKEIYGDKNPDEEEQKINGRLREAEAVRDLANQSFNQCNLEYNTLKSGIEALKTATESRSADLLTRETGFMNSLTHAGFAGEEHFRGCRLAKEDLERLSKKKETLDVQKADIDARRKDREKRLIDEKVKELTSLDIEELTQQNKETEEELAVVQQYTGALREKREANELAKTKVLHMKEKIDAQQMIYNRWSALNTLIGSADGKKFRNFAQGLTFELMVSHANRQLARLSDRYLLTRDENQPLELNVIDNYQGGEIRTTKNLSGGESFIVSLALALGLSRMSSRKVRVDSLFLDEGFGTLDEDALDTALETLASLRQDGKLIGVISHVPAFKERISTKIMVHPVREGRSLLSGPGVTMT